MTTLETLRQLQADYEAEQAKAAHMGLYIPGPAYDAIRIASPSHLAELITALEREVKLWEAHKMRPTGIPRPDRDGQEYVVCNQCRDDYGEPLLYPCPTIRILDGNE